MKVDPELAESVTWAVPALVIFDPSSTLEGSALVNVTVKPGDAGAVRLKLTRTCRSLPTRASEVIRVVANSARLNENPDGANVTSALAPTYPGAEAERRTEPVSARDCAMNEP